MCLYPIYINYFRKSDRDRNRYTYMPACKHTHLYRYEGARGNKKGKR